MIVKTATQTPIIAIATPPTPEPRRTAVRVVEVLRTDRRDRGLRGKSDTLDAENAARAGLAGHANAVPKTNDGTVEMLRQIKIAKDTAVKARTAAMICLKTVLVTATPALREELQPLAKMKLINRCAGLRPGPVNDVHAAAKYTLRSLTPRWQQLDVEIKDHESLLTELTTALTPQLVAAFGVGPDTAAELLIVAGDNIDRVRSEPAWAKLCGAAPIAASSGMTTRHRLNRGGHRQANAALYRSVIVRMQHHEPTKAYVARRIAEGKSKPEIVRCLKRLLAARSGPSCDPSAPSRAKIIELVDGYRSVNAAVESFFATLKRELAWIHQRSTWSTRPPYAPPLFDYIEGFYNPERIQQRLNHQSLDRHRKPRSRMTTPCPLSRVKTTPVCSRSTTWWRNRSLSPALTPLTPSSRSAATTPLTTT